MPARKPEECDRLPVLVQFDGVTEAGYRPRTIGRGQEPRSGHRGDAAMSGTKLFASWLMIMSGKSLGKLQKGKMKIFKFVMDATTEVANRPICQRSRAGRRKRSESFVRQ